MIEAAKDLIRADRARGLTLEEVGRIHFITRERVRQICNQQPDEEKRAREIAAGLMLEPPCVAMEDVYTPPKPVTNIVRFYKLSDRKRLEDADLQTRIKAEYPNYHAIARKYGITVSAGHREGGKSAGPQTRRVLPGHFRTRVTRHRAGGVVTRIFRALPLPQIS